MTNISLRDYDNPKKFLEKLAYRCDLELLKLNTRNILLFFHGYNNLPHEALRVARLIESYKRHNVDTFELACVHWPSNGKILNYTRDRIDGGNCDWRLKLLIEDLHSMGFTIDVVGHSMGCFVIANLLEVLKPGMIRLLFTMGADIASSMCEPDGLWGKHAHKVFRATHYYSNKDGVLVVSAIRNLFFKRLGQIGLPADRPKNWHDVNACKRYGIRDHSDYFGCGKLFQDMFDQVKAA